MQTLNNTITPQDAAKSKNTNIPAAILSGMMFLIPALGVPSELVLQDTLKSAVAAFGILTCALVFFWQRRQETASIQFHGLVLLPIALTLYALGSMIWSHTYLAGVEAIRWFLFSLLMWLSLNIFTKENIPTLVWGIHGGAVVASIWAALQFWFDFSLFPQFASPASTFINRNFFAEYMVCTLPFSILALVTMHQSRWIALVSLLVALNIVALMMTGTRSALFAMLIAIPILLLILIKYRKHLAYYSWQKSSKVTTILLLISGVLTIGSIPSNNSMIKKGTTAIEFSFSRTTTLTKTKEYSEGSFSRRTAMWMPTIRMMFAHPLVGVGAGAWEVQVPPYKKGGEFIEEDYYPHNEYLQLLSEYGLAIGGLFLATLFTYLLITFNKTWKLQDSTLQEAHLRAFALTSLLMLLIVSNTGFSWHLTPTCILFAISLSFLAGSDIRLAIHEAFFAININWSPTLSKITLILLLFSILLAGYITLQAMRAEYNIVQAIHFGNAAKKLHEEKKELPIEDKTILISKMHNAITITPHYNRLTTVVAEQLAAISDWKNAVWIWESAVASRPNDPGLWAKIAHCYIQLHQYDSALNATQHALKLHPDESGMRVLEINLLGKLEKNEQAIQLLTNYFDYNNYDYSLIQSGYLLGLKTKEFRLAIRALELRNKTWPKQAADGYFRLGNIYVEMQDGTKALESFRLGLRLVPSEEKDNFKNQVPEPYREQL